jgi:hypothetical protein
MPFTARWTAPIDSVINQLSADSTHIARVSSPLKEMPQGCERSEEGGNEGVLFMATAKNTMRSWFNETAEE